MPYSDHVGAEAGASLDRAAWRVARAPRSRILVDAAAYYGTLREVLKRARHRVIIIGWDIDSRTPLAADPAETGDDLPLELGPFLCELTRREPQIDIKLLLWDYSLLYVLEREPLPRFQLGWASPPQITICLDGCLPVGAAHHQKLVIVDDRVAFCGGLDLTVRRWDTTAHDPDDPRRVDPKGKPYLPFHDIQMMVDGDAAAALAEVARERWQTATGIALELVHSDTDPWPRGMQAEMREADVAIARTSAPYGTAPALREVEATYKAAIAEAERFIYIENQYLTADVIADALIARMHQRPDLEVLVVIPSRHNGWLEKNVMDAGRVRFVARFEEAGLGDRIRVTAPEVDGKNGPTPVKVHAKVMVIDDRSLRVGSSNLNNRSMGFDSECDLIVLARDEERRRGICRVRDTLIAEHKGVPVERVSEAVATPGSILRALDRLVCERRRLVPVDHDLALADAVPETVSTIADPDGPLLERISIDELMEPRTTRRLISKWPVFAVALAVVALVLLWRYSPLEEWTRLEYLIGPMREVAASGWAPLATLALYLIGGLTVFPITVLIAVTAMVFGPWEGVLYSMIGSVAGALAGYGIGRVLGRKAPSIWQMRDGRIGRLIGVFAGNGVLGLAGLRMLPIAPFMFVNVAAGVARVPFLDFALGSALGLGPGIIAFNFLGVQLEAVLSNGSTQDIVLLVVFFAIWIGVSALLQRLVNRYAGPLRERTK